MLYWISVELMYFYDRTGNRIHKYFDSLRALLCTLYEEKDSNGYWELVILACNGRYFTKEQIEKNRK
jgi:hypothetical protein